MPPKNKARKSTGPRAASTPQQNSTNRNLRQRGSTQVANTSTAHGESSDSDEQPTQPIRRKNQNSAIQSTPGPSGLSSRASTSRANIDDQTTLRLSNGRNRGISSESDSSTSDSDEAPGRIKATPEKNKPSKKRKIIQRKHQDSDYEEDVQPSVSKTTSKSKTHNKSVSSRDMNSLVNKCVYYLLIADQKKCPIKKTDLQKHVFASITDRTSYKDVIDEASIILKKTYGMELVKSEKRKDEFMLINILKPDLGIQEFIDFTPLELQKRGLLFHVLVIIFMNGNSIKEEELTSALKQLHVDLNAREPHPVFGDVRSYLTKELVKQNYLEYMCINKDPPQYEFCWGERAFQEVDKKDLLEFACEIMGDTRPEEWILQHHDAMSSKQESA